jgi:hypothetical protein
LANRFQPQHFTCIINQKPKPVLAKPDTNILAKPILAKPEYKYLGKTDISKTVSSDLAVCMFSLFASRSFDSHVSIESAGNIAAKI